MDKNRPGKELNQFSISRRSFIATAITGLATATLAASPFNFSFIKKSNIKAIAFDAFAIFNPSSVFALAKNLFSEKGEELSNIWRAKQFEYSWLRAAANQYKNFWEVTEDALVYAARKADISLAPQNKKELMEQYLKLNTWQDVHPALETLKQKGIRLSFLSNMTPEMLDSCINYSEIKNYFEDVISTDTVKAYKPDRIAYQLGIDTLKLKKEEILFVAFAGWDASGSKWFGYPTFWLNRSEAPVEELNSVPDSTGKTMNHLVSFISI